MALPRGRGRGTLRPVVRSWARMRRTSWLAFALLLGVLASPAHADVSNITVDPASPSNAAGAKTSYVVTFQTSGTGGLSAAASDSITITFPDGTDVSGQFTAQVLDTTTAPNTNIGFCTDSGQNVKCSLNSGKSIGGGDTVKVVLHGIINPGAGATHLFV